MKKPPAFARGHSHAFECLMRRVLGPRGLRTRSRTTLGRTCERIFCERAGESKLDVFVENGSKNAKKVQFFFFFIGQFVAGTRIRVTVPLEGYRRKAFVEQLFVERAKFTLSTSPHDQFDGTSTRRKMTKVYNRCTARSIVIIITTPSETRVKEKAGFQRFAANRGAQER